MEVNQDELMMITKVLSQLHSRLLLRPPPHMNSNKTVKEIHERSMSVAHAYKAHRKESVYPKFIRVERSCVVGRGSWVMSKGHASPCVFN